jgi:peptidylprolyl isomerase
MSCDEFDDISTERDGGLLKNILVHGADGERPSKGCVATVHYVGVLSPDGTVFDSSRDRGEPLKFTVGGDDFIKGWDVGIASMSRGEKAILRMSPSYAYGDEGQPPKIPGGATLEYEVELISWDPKLKEPEEMTVVERSKHVQKCKLLGNNAFKQQDWPFAVYAYEEGIKYISYEPGRDGIRDINFDHGGAEQLEEDHHLLVALLTNLAACYLKVGDESRAADRCTEALNLQPENMKALFRRSQARFALGDWDRVMADVSRMLELEPQNKAVEQMRRSAEVEMKKGEKKSKAMFSKMFGDNESLQLEKDSPKQAECGDGAQSRGRADAETLARRKIVRARRSQAAPAGVPETSKEIQSPTEV